MLVLIRKATREVKDNIIDTLKMSYSISTSIIYNVEEDECGLWNIALQLGKGIDSGITYDKGIYTLMLEDVDEIINVYFNTSDIGRITLI